MPDKRDGGWVARGKRRLKAFIQMRTIQRKGGSIWCCCWRWGDKKLRKHLVYTNRENFLLIQAHFPRCVGRLRTFGDNAISLSSLVSMLRGWENIRRHVNCARGNNNSVIKSFLTFIRRSLSIRASKDFEVIVEFSRDSRKAYLRTWNSLKIDTISMMIE